MFDSQVSVTIGEDGLRQRLLYFASDIHAYALRAPEAGIGILNYPPGANCAGLAYLAPALDSEAGQSLWFALLDGLTAKAGEQGVVAIRAEVDDAAPAAFETFRRCDFAVYARQTLWAGSPPIDISGRRALRRAGADEIDAAHDAWNARLPGLIRQAQGPAKSAEQYALDERHSPSGFAAMHRGKGRALIDLYLPLEGADQADQIVGDVLAAVGRTARKIVFRLRHDMEWVGNPLKQAGFECVGSQAVMIRHTLARVQHYSFKTIPAKTGPLPTESLMSISQSEERIGEGQRQPAK